MRHCLVFSLKPTLLATQADWHSPSLQPPHLAGCTGTHLPEILRDYYCQQISWCFTFSAPVCSLSSTAGALQWGTSGLHLDTISAQELITQTRVSGVIGSSWSLSTLVIELTLLLHWDEVTWTQVIVRFGLYWSFNSHLEHHWWSCGPREEHSEVCPPDTWVFSWWSCCPGYSHCSVTTWSARAPPCSCSWCRHLCHSPPRHHETYPECGQSHEPGCRQHWSLEYSVDHKFCVTHDTCGRVQCSYGSDCTKFHHSTAVKRVTHATSPGNTQSVIIPDSILLCPHVQTRDQDTWDTVAIILYCHMIATYVPVSGVGLVILWVQIIAVVTERS